MEHNKSNNAIFTIILNVYGRADTLLDPKLPKKSSAT